MRCLKRNQTPFYFCKYSGKTAITDDYGNQTGEYKVTYGNAVKMLANISSAAGSSQTEQFGKDIKYDKVIVTDEMSVGIDEHTVLFVDKEPEYDADGTPLFDYVIKKVAKSLNSISYAISKVDVS